jgi:DeoR/GlpR family transcriptional regulator of sugar metabolism
VALLARQRQELILAEVTRLGTVPVSDLMRLLDVSDVTVRRDLRALAEGGQIEKVHGGAVLSGGLSAVEPAFEQKSHDRLEQKDAIAAEVVGLIKPGSAIALTAGSTTWRVALQLAAIGELTVVTNSIPVAAALHAARWPELTVIQTGGIRTPSDALVGPIAVSSIRSLHFDAVIMGVHGITERAGFTSPNLLEAETNQAFIAAAERMIVVADSSKWGVAGLARIAALSEADVVVTDTDLPADARTALADQAIAVRLAPVRSADGRRERR